MSSEQAEYRLSILEPIIKDIQNRINPNCKRYIKIFWNERAKRDEFEWDYELLESHIKSSKSGIYNMYHIDLDDGTQIFYYTIKKDHPGFHGYSFNGFKVYD